MPHPLDELAAEHDYRECDPLNLDGDPFRNRQVDVLAFRSGAACTSCPDLKACAQQGACRKALGPKAGASADAGYERLLACLDSFDRRAKFYREAVARSRQDAFRVSTFGGLLSKVEVLIETAAKLIPEGFIDAAEFVLNEAILDYQSMEDRIQDWATD